MRLIVVYVLLVVLLLEACCYRAICDCKAPYLELSYKTASGSCWPDSLGMLKMRILSAATGDTIGEDSIDSNLHCPIELPLEVPHSFYYVIFSDSLGLSDTIRVNYVFVPEDKENRCCTCPGTQNISVTLNGQAISIENYTRVLP